MATFLPAFAVKNSHSILEPYADVHDQGSLLLRMDLILWDMRFPRPACSIRRKHGSRIAL